MPLGYKKSRNAGQFVAGFLYKVAGNLSQRIFRLPFVIIFLRHLGLVTFLAQPFHEGDAFVGDEGAGVATAHVAGAVGRELHAQAGNLVAAHFLAGGDAFPSRDGGVAEPAEAFNVDGTAFLHEVSHDVRQCTEHGMGVGGRHGRLTRDAVGKFLRFYGFAYGDAAGIPQVVDCLLYTFPKNHTNLLFRSSAQCGQDGLATY